jgi:hypothetical protein
MVVKRAKLEEFSKSKVVRRAFSKKQLARESQQEQGAKAGFVERVRGSRDEAEDVYLVRRRSTVRPQTTGGAARPVHSPPYEAAEDAAPAPLGSLLGAEIQVYSASTDMDWIGTGDDAGATERRPSTSPTHPSSPGQIMPPGHIRPATGHRPVGFDDRSLQHSIDSAPKAVVAPPSLTSRPCTSPIFRGAEPRGYFVNEEDDEVVLTATRRCVPRERQRELAARRRLTPVTDANEERASAPTRHNLPSFALAPQPPFFCARATTSLLLRSLRWPTTSFLLRSLADNLLSFALASMASNVLSFELARRQPPFFCARFDGQQHSFFCARFARSSFLLRSLANNLLLLRFPPNFRAPDPAPTHARRCR